MADLQDTDEFLVNRAGASYCLQAQNLMADLLDDDLMLVQRSGASYKATGADVKNSIGTPSIKPTPPDVGAVPGFQGGSGTVGDPFILAPKTIPSPGGNTQSDELITITGQQPNALVLFTDNSVGAGTRFAQPIGLTDGAGAWSGRLQYIDTPDSTADTAYQGALQIGDVYFSWTINQFVSLPPVMGAVTLSDSTAGANRFTSEVFPVSATLTDDGTPTSTKALKAWVEGALARSPVSSAITQVSTGPIYSAGVTSYGTHIVSNYAGLFNGQTSTDPNDGVWVRPDNSGAVFAQTIVVGSTLRVWAYGQSGNLQLNQSITVGSSVPATFGWVDCTPSITGRLPFNLISLGFVGGNPVNGSAFNAIEVDGIILSDSATVLSLTDDTDLANFDPGDAVTELGGGDDATGTVGSVDTAANTITLSAPSGTWDVGSQVLGSVKTIVTTPESDEIVQVDAIDYISTTTATGTSDGNPASFQGNFADLFTDGAFGGYGISLISSISATRIHTYTFNPPLQPSASLGVACYAVENAPSYGIASLAFNGSAFTDLTVGSGTTVPGISSGALYAMPGYTAGTAVSTIQYKMTALGGSADIVYAFYVDGVRIVDSTLLTLASDKDLANFAPGDAVYQSPPGGTDTDEITNVEVDTPAQGQTRLTFASNQNLAGVAVGSYVVQENATISSVSRQYSDGIGTSVTGWDATYNGNPFLAGTDSYLTHLKLTAGFPDGYTVTFSPPLTGVNQFTMRGGTYSPFNSFDITVSDGMESNTATYVTQNEYASPADMTPLVPANRVVSSVRIFSNVENCGFLSITMNNNRLIDGDNFDAYVPSGIVESVNAAGNSLVVHQDTGSWGPANAGHYLITEAAETTGTVGAVDPTGPAITLSSSSGTWIANSGRIVVGPTKPSQSVRLYCDIDGAGNVADLQSADPGYIAWTPSGTTPGPYTGNITFPAVLPSGNPPDTELPAGTKLQVSVQASNVVGSSSADSNVITPA